jgi:hypothetical protein
MRAPRCRCRGVHRAEGAEAVAGRTCACGEDAPREPAALDPPPGTGALLVIVDGVERAPWATIRAAEGELAEEREDKKPASSFAPGAPTVKSSRHAAPGAPL